LNFLAKTSSFAGTPGFTDGVINFYSGTNVLPLSIASTGVTSAMFIRPFTTNTYSIGSSSLIWLSGYFQKLNFVPNGTAVSSGTATLVAGTVTITTTLITASSQVFLTYHTTSGTLGVLACPTRTAATSFVINSMTTANTTNTADVSTVDWWIIN